MREIRGLIHEIHRGKNLESNLKRYEDIAVRVYSDYTALELTLSGYVMLQEAMEEKPELAQKEKRVIDSICEAIGSLTEEACAYEKIISAMSELRQEITDKMDLFTAYTDRLICYEYVLNRMELKYMPEKELDRRFAGMDEEMVLREIMGYVFSDDNQQVIQEKLNILLGQIPVHMTKNKLFEKIEEAATLYKGGDRSSLDNFIYMLRTSAMIYEPQKYVGEYPECGEILERLERADYKAMEKAEYEEMTALLEKGARAIHELTDFYYAMQKVVNAIYAFCLVSPYREAESKTLKETKAIWHHLSKREYEDEMLFPLEGKIEECFEKSSYLESVLFEIRDSYKKELSELEAEKAFDDLFLISNLLSDSIFIDLDRSLKEETADEDYVRKQIEKFIQELSDKMSLVSRPVKQAIMGRMLEALPRFFQTTEEIEQYIRVNLLGCRDKAEKYIVISILQDLIQEEQEW